MKATARCRPSVGRKLAECYEVRRNRDDSSNPNASSGVDRCQTRPCKIPVFCRLARLEKRLDSRCATRNASAARRHAPSQHGRYRTPKQLARYAKNLKQPRELKVESRAVLRTGQEPNFWVFSQWFWGVREVVFRIKVIENEEIRLIIVSPRRA